jgi:hypothetical protein
MMAQNMNQSGQAFANVQKRMQSLRDQGIAQGQLQTNLAYDRGQNAMDRYSQLSQMQTDTDVGHRQRLSSLATGKSGLYQQMLSDQAKYKQQQSQNYWNMVPGLAQAGATVYGASQAAKK